MNLTTLQDSIQQKCDGIRDRFHAHGWRFKKVALSHHIYLVWRPNHPEYTYFVTWISQGGGQFFLLPEKPGLESFQEANRILRRNGES